MLVDSLHNVHFQCLSCAMFLLLSFNAGLADANDNVCTLPLLELLCYACRNSDTRQTAAANDAAIQQIFALATQPSTNDSSFDPYLNKGGLLLEQGRDGKYSDNMGSSRAGLKGSRLVGGGGAGQQGAWGAAGEEGVGEGNGCCGVASAAMELLLVLGEAKEVKPKLAAPLVEVRTFCKSMGRLVSCAGMYNRTSGPAQRFHPTSRPKNLSAKMP